MTGLRSALAVSALVALAACNTAPSTPRQPTNVGASAAAPIVPGTGQINGGISNAEVQRVPAGPGAQAPIVPGTGQINGGISNAEVDRVGGGPPSR